MKEKDFGGVVELPFVFKLGWGCLSRACRHSFSGTWVGTYDVVGNQLMRLQFPGHPSPIIRIDTELPSI